MKKGLCFLCGCLLCGCSFATHLPEGIQRTKNQYAIEKNGSLSVIVDNKDYAALLETLWKKKYPQAANVLHIQVSTTAAIQEADVVWCSDKEALYHKEEAYTLSGFEDALEIPWPASLQRKANKDSFVPIAGSGLLYMWNADTLHKAGKSYDTIQTFEQLQGIDKAYYQNRKAAYSYPFFFDGTNPRQVSLTGVLKETHFQAHLHRFRSFNTTLALSDDTLDTTPFYEDGGYVSGLWQNDDTSYRSSTAYQAGHLHVAPMPSYEKEDLHPYLKVYGFIANKNTKSPNALYAFLQLARSRKAICGMLETTSLIPLVEADKVERLGLYDTVMKETLTAMNASVYKDDTRIEEKPSICVSDLYEQSDLLSMIQNSLYRKEKDAVLVKEMAPMIRRWIYMQ